MMAYVSSKVEVLDAEKFFFLFIRRPSSSVDDAGQVGGRRLNQGGFDVVGRIRRSRKFSDSCYSVCPQLHREQGVGLLGQSNFLVLTVFV